MPQCNSNNSLAPELNEIRSKNEAIWMNSLYRPRLKKDPNLVYIGHLGPKIRTSRQGQSANPVDFTAKKKKMLALFKTKSVHPKTYSSPSSREK